MSIFDETLTMNNGLKIPKMALTYRRFMIIKHLKQSKKKSYVQAEIDFVISDEDMDKLKKFTPVDYGKAGVFPVFGGKM